MTHAVVTEHLADYLEGDLALDVRALVDAHLDVCTDCAREVREMQQTIRLLRAMPEPEVPPMIAANVMRRIRAGETRPSLIERIQRAVEGVLEPSFVLPATAVAVAGLAVVLVQQVESGGSLLDWATGARDEAVVTAEAGVGEEALVLAEERLERGFGASVARDPETRSVGAVPAPNRARVEPVAEALASASAARASGSAAPRARSGSHERLASAGAGREGTAYMTWEQTGWSAGLSARATEAARGGRERVLMQGFASDVSGPAIMPSSRVGGELTSATLARESAGGMRGLSLGEVGGAGVEDARDVWLSRALGQPVEFARFIAQRNLAEQELWVARLSERARSRGLLAEVIEALRASGDEKAAWLAEDFAAQARADSGSEGRDDSTDVSTPSLEMEARR